MIEHTDAMIWGGGFMWFFWIFLVLVIAVLIKLLSESSKNQNGTTGNYDEAIMQLRNRFARGEIDKEEFERRKHELEQP